MENKRRNLSGIYIFEKFDTDPKREPTCFEDCTEETQDKWLNSLEPEALRNLAKMLGKTLIELADYAGIVKGDPED
jgi:hypothetical protein